MPIIQQSWMKSLHTEQADKAQAQALSAERRGSKAPASSPHQLKLQAAKDGQPTKGAAKPARQRGL